MVGSSIVCCGRDECTRFGDTFNSIDLNNYLGSNKSLADPFNSKPSVIHLQCLRFQLGINALYHIWEFLSDCKCGDYLGV